MLPIIDLIFAIATITFILAIFPQMHKNYRLKKIKSQSIPWHIITVLGLCGIGFGHILCGYWISVLTTIVQIVERIILIGQIKYYR